MPPPSLILSTYFHILLSLDSFRQIVEEVGKENAFIFGLSSDEVMNYEKNGGYDPYEIYNNDPDVRRVVDQLVDAFAPKI